MKKPPLISMLSLAVLALVLTVAADGNRFLAFVLAMTYINLLWATGMNLMYGYLGLMPLMFAGIAGISAYALLHFIREWHWSFWQAMPVATLLGAVSGVALGLPSLRLKGFYFTLCSLVIQSALTLAFIFFPKYTNGDTGINQIAPPEWWGGTQLTGLGLELVIALVTLLGLAVTAWVTRSDLGQRFVAVREDDLLAEGLGINVVRTKIIAFFIVSLFAGVGGCFYAVYVGFISPRAFDVLVSMNIWLFVAFGGRGTLAGPIIGAFVLAPIPFLLQEIQAFRDVLSGSLIIAVTLLMPAGVYGAYLARRAGRSARTIEVKIQEQRV